MTFFSNLHGRFIFPYVEKKKKRSTCDFLSKLSRSETFSSPELESFQWERIKFILNHAYENTAFYRKKLQDESIHPSDIKSFEDFKRIPTITRDDLNNHLEQLLANNILEKNRHFATTGGSTGVATRFARDNFCLSIKKASEYRFNMWAGWNPGEKILAYWPAMTDFSDSPPRGILKSSLYTRYLKLFAGKLNEKVLSEHLKYYNKFQPHLIRAFPSALQKFAEYIENSAKRPLSPKAIICVGEPLLNHQRTLFSKTFNCDVFNCYVSRECGNIACECQKHSGLHIAEELIYLEIENKGKGEIGEILLTDLWNIGMPFIRYRIQDAASWETSECSCGKKHKKIGINAARLSDFLISPVDGSYISGSSLTHYLLAEGPRVGRVKIIQDAADHIQVQLVGTAELNKNAEKHIRSRLDTIFKAKMRVDFVYFDNIPLLTSGKYSFVERKF